ncbi:MAG: hypothetical protein CMK07_03870 [Ponticaulis sp.]|nr:hypothetical protein [Ponticaulis sp.]
MKRVGICLAVAGLALAASAEDLSQTDLQAALDELRSLKEMQAATDARIQALEEVLLQGASSTVQQAESDADVMRLASTALPETQTPAEGAPDKLAQTADMLLRFEGNYSDSSRADRERGVMRARLGATYQVDDRMEVGALLETGDSEDPNSGYLTFDEFADDFEISLSRAYVSYDLGGVNIIGGKFPKPFRSTDLLWDGDVNPVGLALQSDWQVSSNSSIDLSGIYFVVDENSTGPDSQMIGGQLAFDSGIGEALSLGLALGYYDYELDHVGGADGGDFRNNLLNTNGGYLSDYDLVDVLASATWSGLSERWPVGIEIDYVTNTGAAVDADTAIGVDLDIGRTSQPHDWGMSYGYGEVGVDAVLGAFSNDNFAIGTNYMVHEFGASYLLTENVTLSGALYHYKPLNSLYAAGFMPDEWLDRLRLNVSIAY